MHPTMPMHERATIDAIAWAIKRYRDTGKPYIVTDFPRVLLDCPENREAFPDEKVIFCADDIAERYLGD